MKRSAVGDFVVGGRTAMMKPRLNWPMMRMSLKSVLVTVRLRRSSGSALLNCALMSGSALFLPIFGLLGIDYGYGFDKIPGIPDANKGQFHFSIAKQIGGFN